MRLRRLSPAPTAVPLVFVLCFSFLLPPTCSSGASAGTAEVLAVPPQPQPPPPPPPPLSSSSSAPEGFAFTIPQQPWRDPSDVGRSLREQEALERCSRAGGHAPVPKTCVGRQMRTPDFWQRNGRGHGPAALRAPTCPALPAGMFSGSKPKGLFPRPRRDMRLTKLLVVSGRLVYTCRALARASSAKSSSSSPPQPPTAAPATAALPRPKGRLVRKRLTADVYDLGAFLARRKQLASAGRLTRLAPEAGDMPHIGRLAASGMSSPVATSANKVDGRRRGSVPLETLSINEADDGILSNILTFLGLGQTQGQGNGQGRPQRQRRIVLEQRGWKTAPPRRRPPGTGASADIVDGAGEDMEWAFFILADIPDGYSYRRSIDLGRGGGGSSDGTTKRPRTTPQQRQQQEQIDDRERQRQVRERVASAPVYVYRVLTRGGGARVPPSPPPPSPPSQPGSRLAPAAAASQSAPPKPSSPSARESKTAAAAAASAALSSDECEPAAPGKPAGPVPEPELTVAQYWVYEQPRLGGTLWAADEDFCTPTARSY